MTPLPEGLPTMTESLRASINYFAKGGHCEPVPLPEEDAECQNCGGSGSVSVHPEFGSTPCPECHAKKECDTKYHEDLKDEEWENCPDCGVSLIEEDAKTAGEGNWQPHRCVWCGCPQTQNPHPDAGKPDKLLEVGAMWECLPCCFGRSMRARDRLHRTETSLAESRAEVEKLRSTLTTIVDDSVEKITALREENKRLREALETEETARMWESELVNTPDNTFVIGNAEAKRSAADRMRKAILLPTAPGDKGKRGEW